MSLELEYAIKKDIRNNPIVREVDLEQKREFFRTLALITAIVGMAIFAATQPFKMASSGYEIERLRRQLGEEESLRRKLTLEVEMWRSPELLERRALKELRMVSPTSGDMVVLEIVPAPTSPRAAVLADAGRELR
jgi:hypothetical protein